MPFTNHRGRSGTKQPICVDPPSGDDYSSSSEYVASLEEDESDEEFVDLRLDKDDKPTSHPTEDEWDSEQEAWDPDRMEDEDAEDLMRDGIVDQTAADPDEEALFDGNLYPPEYYREGLSGINESHYMRKRYSPQTLARLRYIRSQWAAYCEKVLQEDWKACLGKLRLRLVIQFIQWHLNQKTGKDGRVKPSLRSYNSLINFWLMFRLVFERVMLRKIDPYVDGRHVRNAIRELSRKFALTYQPRSNRSMTISDLLHQIDTTLRTPKKNFKLGEQRILAVLFFLLMAPAGARPSSILKLRFRDIRITLVRDPKGGHPRLLIEFKLVHVKAYLDPKEQKSFLLPEIIWEPTFMLSPHVFLLGILVRHRAFVVESLNDNIENIMRLQIPPKQTELPLPLKREMDAVYIFRNIERDYSGSYQPSQQHISLGKVTQWVERIGQLAGFQDTTINYSLRYMAGNSMDQSVNISESLRNLVMGHAPNSETFQRHYLNRHVCADLWAIHRQLDPQHELVRQATSHGHSRSDRRPVALTTEQAAALKNDRKMVSMAARLTSMRKKTKERKALRLKMRSRHAKLCREKLHEIREEWTEKQAVEDIEWQIQGNDVEELVGDKETALLHPLQAKMVDALKEAVETDFERQLKRRAYAIVTIAAYCTVQESGGRGALEPDPPAPPELRLAPVDRIAQLRASATVERPGQRLTRCFICIAKALTVPMDDPWYNSLCRNFFSTQDLSRHFKRAHVKPIRPGQRIRCPLCVPEVWLQHKAHFQNHSEQVHGVKS